MASRPARPRLTDADKAAREAAALAARERARSHGAATGTGAYGTAPKALLGAHGSDNTHLDVRMMQAAAATLFRAPSAPIAAARPSGPTPAPSKVHSDPSLPTGWSAASDSATGRVYYFESATGRSQWSHPRGVMSPSFAATPPVVTEGGELPLGWFRATRPEDGRVYYYNREGGTQWHAPASTSTAVSTVTSTVSVPTAGVKRPAEAGVDGGGDSVKRPRGV